MENGEQTPEQVAEQYVTIKPPAPYEKFYRVMSTGGLLLYRKSFWDAEYVARNFRRAVAAAIRADRAARHPATPEQSR